MADSTKSKTEAVSQVSTTNDIEKVIQDKFGTPQESDVAFNDSKEEAIKILQSEDSSKDEKIEITSIERITLPSPSPVSDIEKKINRLVNGGSK